MGIPFPQTLRIITFLVFKQPVGLFGDHSLEFPSAMITRKLGPALAAGCPVIVKPSELTPLSALEIAKIFEEAGLPQGVLSSYCRAGCCRPY